ncbi:radical SAM protein [Desulfosporosinus nitroreducens]|uniref:radical SAM protein n=1 Tax=Desulfosporosinus nitroreducens TaxID=2018668 RepID=UPI00207CBCC7|nr:radical SAM protein [Desulfosporosinus nitroreducens]MCO1603422.1 radical SAM protein [Desulfosporosinus nitroreducens]
MDLNNSNGVLEINSYSVETNNWIKRGWDVRVNNFPAEIYFDYPTKTKSVSLTGTACSLNCAHCGGHYLKGMTDVKELTSQLCSELSFSSALISGGCTQDGKVPFWNRLDLLQELKNRKVRLNFHVGLISEKEVQLLRGLADVVSFDFVGDDDTIREVYGLEHKLEDYIRVYKDLRKQAKIIPHLTLGLKGGIWSGEEKALDILEDLGLDGLVLNVFIPTPGTRYSDRTPPNLEEVISFLAKARVRFPKTSLALGCMRPKGSYRQKLDEASVALGINRIVIPTPKARQLVKEKGLIIKRGEECCAL